MGWVCGAPGCQSESYRDFLPDVIECCGCGALWFIDREAGCMRRYGDREPATPQQPAPAEGR